jgi:hypothetical protein
MSCICTVNALNKLVSGKAAVRLRPHFDMPNSYLNRYTVAKGAILYSHAADVRMTSLGTATV